MSLATCVGFCLHFGWTPSIGQCALSAGFFCVDDGKDHRTWLILPQRHSRYYPNQYRLPFHALSNRALNTWLHQMRYFLKWTDVNAKCIQISSAPTKLKVISISGVSHTPRFMTNIKTHVNIPQTSNIQQSHWATFLIAYTSQFQKRNGIWQHCLSVNMLHKCKYARLDPGGRRVKSRIRTGNVAAFIAEQSA